MFFRFHSPWFITYKLNKCQCMHDSKWPHTNYQTWRSHMPYHKSLDEACDDHMQKIFLVAKPEWASLCFYCKDLWTYNRWVRTGNNWVILPITDNIDQTIFSKTLSQRFDNVLSILANHYQWQKKCYFS